MPQVSAVNEALEIEEPEKLVALVRFPPFNTFPKWFVRFSEWLLGFKKINDLIPTLPTDTDAFLKELEKHTAAYAVEGQENIPAAGPVVLVGNHPLGGADSAAAARILHDSGRSFWILSNNKMRVPRNMQIAHNLLPIDIYSGGSANGQSMRRIVKEFGKSIDCLMIFPGIRCSHLDVGKRAIVDGPWEPSFLKIAERADAQIVPLTFSGRNSNFYYFFGLISKHVRGLFMAREFSLQKGKSYRVQVHPPLKREPDETQDAFMTRVRQQIEDAR